MHFADAAMYASKQRGRNRTTAHRGCSSRAREKLPRMDTPPRLVGINHVALEVGSIEEALAFYGRFFDLHLRGVAPGMAFVDIGDQFLALAEGRRQGADDGRHFGLVVDDKEAVRALLEEAGVAIEPAAGSTSATRGATGSRSSTIATSSSPRPRPC